jgi:hypothetical protein
LTLDLLLFAPLDLGGQARAGLTLDLLLFAPLDFGGQARLRLDRSRDSSGHI